MNPLRKLTALCRKEKLDADMSAEMRAHLELQTEENVRRGMSPEEAHYAALRAFGGVEQVKEVARAQRTSVVVEELLRDVRHAFRSLAKAPGFTGVAVLSLALALGVNSAVFALFNAIVLRPAVALRPEEVVSLFNGRHAAQRDFRPFSHAEFLALRAAKDTFADVAATQITSVGTTGNQGVRRTRAYLTSENYFSLLGVAPVLGRFYNAEECQPNANIPVVVASHALWQREGGDTGFVGRTLPINGRPHTVIGVAPAEFKDLSPFLTGELWLPLGLMTEFSGATGDLSQPKTHVLNLTARLAPGVTRDSLAARMASLGERLTQLQPEQSGGRRELHAEVPSRLNVSSSPSGGDPMMPISIGLFSMSACVLLIACLNLANMLLARGSSREMEIALRLALGADRWRIVRQLLVEGLVLACLGGVLGLLVAGWGNDLLLRSFSSAAADHGQSLALDLRPDGRVFGATFVVCLVATLFFSLGPALKASRVDLLSALKIQNGGTSGAGRLHHFFSLRHCLVMGQIALSLMLLFSAALFFRGALKASSVAPGFDPDGALVADLDYSLTSLRENDAQRSLFSALDFIATQPGVSSVAAATFVPYSSRSNGRNVRPAQQASETDSSATEAARSATPLFTPVTSGYFDATGVRLIQGRDFTPAEARDPAARRVAIIDERLAQKLFPSANALGERIRIGSTEAEIVGICAPHRHNNRRANFPERVFVPYAGGHDGRAFILVRYASNNPAAVAAAVGSLRAALRTFDAELPLLQITTLSRLVAQDSTAWLARVGAIFFGLFGAIALVLAVVGVYGVKAYAVARRTREIGIRIAVGARPREVCALLLKQGALQIAVGMCGGVFLAFGAGKILAKMLYQVQPTDPLALGSSAALLAVAALLACVIPARRAARMDPLKALRTE